MKNLKEKEIVTWSHENQQKCGTLYLKRLKCVNTCDLSENVTVAGKSVSRFKLGKSYDLWCTEGEDETTILVFVPGADRAGGLVLKQSVFADWKRAPDVVDVTCGGTSFVLIANSQGERLLVPSKNMYPDDVSLLLPFGSRYDYWRPEFVFDGNEWFFGVAFYRNDADGIFSSKKRRWLAFFRVDTQSWLPFDCCSRSVNFLLVALSEHPVEVGNFRIQFFREVFHFSFI